MKTPRTILLLLPLILGCLGLRASAEPPVPPAAREGGDVALLYRDELQRLQGPAGAPKHRLVLRTVSGVEPRQWVFAVVFANGHVGVSSPAYLRQYIALTLHEGDTLEWAPGCDRWGGEPLLSSEPDLAAFKTFLRERKIHFILVPAG
jgi:hypothetical protein